MISIVHEKENATNESNRKLIIIVFKDTLLLKYV